MASVLAPCSSPSRQLENCEVFPFRTVAVAVITAPFAVPGVAKSNAACPPTFVVAFVSPRNVFPSPVPDESQAAFAKNWTRKVVLGVLVRLPCTSVVPVPVGHRRRLAVLGSGVESDAQADIATDRVRQDRVVLVELPDIRIPKSPLPLMMFPSTVLAEAGASADPRIDIPLPRLLLIAFCAAPLGPPTIVLNAPTRSIPSVEFGPMTFPSMTSADASKI